MTDQRFELNYIGPESVALLAQLSVDTFLQAYADAHDAEDLDAFCRDNYAEQPLASVLWDGSTRVVVAFEQQTPVGYYVLRHQECPWPLDGLSSELKKIYVLAAYFGSGLGRVLFDDAVSAARDAGSHWLWLSVADTNHRARAFYDHLGFETVGVGPVIAVGRQRLTSSIMALAIGPGAGHA